MTTYDFDDGSGPVPAHRHTNGQGWIADTATVDTSVYVSEHAKVYGKALVNGAVKIFDRVRVSGQASINDKVALYDDAYISDNVILSDAVVIAGDAQILGYTILTENIRVIGSTVMNQAIRLAGSADILDGTIGNRSPKLRPPKTITSYETQRDWLLTHVTKHLCPDTEKNCVPKDFSCVAPHSCLDCWQHFLFLKTK